MKFRIGLVASSAVFCAFCIAWAGFRAYSPSAGQTGAASHQGIACDDDVYDFGSKRIGQSVSHVFLLRNTGRHELEIINVRPGCSCTKAEYDQKTIKPGSSLPLKLTVSLEDKRGPVEQHIVVESNDPQRKFLLLRIKGMVESEFSLTPKAISFGKVARGESLTGSVDIDATGSGPFKLLKVHCDSPLCQIDQETIDEGKSYRISIRTTSSLPAGLWKTSIRLRTDNKTEPRITIPVTANVQAVAAPTNEN